MRVSIGKGLCFVSALLSLSGCYGDPVANSKPADVSAQFFWNDGAGNWMAQQNVDFTVAGEDVFVTNIMLQDSIPAGPQRNGVLLKSIGQERCTEKTHLHKPMVDGNVVFRGRYKMCATLLKRDGNKLQMDYYSAQSSPEHSWVEVKTHVVFDAQLWSFGCVVQLISAASSYIDDPQMLPMREIKHQECNYLRPG